MLSKKLSKKYGKNNPIFFDEIINLCTEYSKQYVCRMIKEEERRGELICFERGVYYVPKKTFFGNAVICADQVAEKKYLKCNNEVFGIYGGLTLLNEFGITTQVPNTPVIITNNEATRKRIIKIANNEYILRKSRCEITSKNYAAYMIVQLINDMDNNDSINESSKMKISCFIKNNKISKEQLVSLSSYFPGKTIKRIARSFIFNGTI